MGSTESLKAHLVIFLVFFFSFISMYFTYLKYEVNRDYDVDFGSPDEQVYE
jgi:hypothetical protein